MGKDCPNPKDIRENDRRKGAYNNGKGRLSNPVIDVLNINHDSEQNGEIWAECPKCGRKQDNSLECNACGIIFEKYARHQKEIEGLSNQGLSAIDYQSPGLIRISHVIVAIAISISLIIFAILNLSGNGSDNSNKQRSMPLKFTYASTPQAPLKGIAKQLYDAYPPRNNIERARNATVFIKTSWAYGSGFFIDNSCHIVTNRHVIEFDREKISDLKMRLSRLYQQIEDEEKIIADAESDVVKITDYDNRQRYEEKIKGRRMNLQKAQKEYDKAVSALDDIEFGLGGREFKVILIDGTEYEGRVADASEIHDLALLEIDATGCPYIKTTNATNLEQGSRVYTIGNPEGFIYTVTSGIVSGYRNISGNLFVQTDASINPGNSGGPLVDDRGKAVGVNTSVYMYANGIGFAIPIDTVLSEFEELIVKP